MDDKARRAQYIASLPRRKVPAGCGQQRRHDEREWRQQFEDTVPTGPQDLEVCIEPPDKRSPRIGLVLIIVTGVPALIALGNALAWVWTAITT